MASGANLRPPPLMAHNLSATSSLRGSGIVTPFHEDDENAPLLRSSDIERAAYRGTRKS